MEYTLGAWAETAKADATQEALSYTKNTWDATNATIFLVEKDGEATIVNELPALPLEEGMIVRAANGRGGFGAPAKDNSTEAVEHVGAEDRAQKVIKNGQIIIVRDGREYNALGAELK